MSGRNVLHAILFVHFCFFASTSMAEDLSNTSCDDLKRWSSAIDVSEDQGNGRDRRERQIRSASALFESAETTRTFGKVFSIWTDRDIQNASGQIFRCQGYFLGRGQDKLSGTRLVAALNSLNITKQQRAETSAKQAEASIIIHIHRPDCNRLAAWAADGAALGGSLERRQDHMFADSRTQAVFDLGFSEWNIYDMHKMVRYVADCRNQLYPRDSASARSMNEADRNAQMGMQIAQGYVGSLIRRKGSINQSVADKLEKMD